jgi:hypothetical protein
MMDVRPSTFLSSKKGGVCALKEAKTSRLSYGKDKTNLSAEVVAKMRSAEQLCSSLSAGSKNRLRSYQSRLAATAGEKPIFDDLVIKLAKRFALDTKDFNRQIAYLNDLVDEDGVHFSRSYKLYSKASEAMWRFTLPDHTSFRWNQNYVKSLERLKMEFSRLKLKPLSYYCDDDIRKAVPKATTHSGYLWLETGVKKKGDHMEGIHDVFQGELERALKEGSFNYPILIAFRTQASGEFEDDGSQTDKCKHKTRVVSMVDLRQIIAELMFAKPIQKYMSRVDWYAGGKDDFGISSIVTRCRVKYSRFLSIDYSSFDQTISSWLIKDAFEVLKCAFQMSEHEDDIFNLIVNDFIHKDFILSEGILHSDRGVPSGSMFTQIIDSIVNVLVVRTFFNSIHAEAEMTVMGDDNVIFTNSDVTMEEMASYIAKNFGLIVKTDDKSSSGSTKKDNVKFLSCYWLDNGKWRHPHQLLSRLAFPERFRQYVDSGDNQIQPYHVLHAYILAYPAGMAQLIDVARFKREYPVSRKEIMNLVDSRLLPGYYGYNRDYVMNVV